MDSWFALLILGPDWVCVGGCGCGWVWVGVGQADQLGRVCRSEG